jgi:hypothetical protein
LVSVRLDAGLLASGAQLVTLIGTTPTNVLGRVGHGLGYLARQAQGTDAR